MPHHSSPLDEKSLYPCPQWLYYPIFPDSAWSRSPEPRTKSLSLLEPRPQPCVVPTASSRHHACTVTTRARRLTYLPAGGPSRWSYTCAIFAVRMRFALVRPSLNLCRTSCCLTLSAPRACERACVHSARSSVAKRERR